MSLDPKENRQQREIEKASKPPPELEPPFPFPRVNFDPFFFNVTVLTRREEGADE